ncbi:MULTISPECIES: alpha/beta fold hydrolase [Bradyrhizobium]|uniref:alpha/beta fold hydrolase n=1 Tax=Bradyrhizobium TaxID=374 RepID=UPI00042686C8|nr:MULTISPECIES: alpha/beta hydrolase [Bradyrhizobium]WLB86987.1 alpha/beta hydrolase [Bradyrhizobium japonicum USDA 135]GLR97231.1 alpha/beta hydrolase [Bradyrhizobium liaoningense]
MDSASSAGPTVVLVHGAWADASSWRLVIPRLLDQGVPVVAVQNPTTSLAEDVSATKRVLAAIEGPVVLVGHSWGGAVITESGNDPKVKALVYVAAFAPKAGESVGDQVGAHASPPALSRIVDSGDGFLKLSEEGWISDVAQDLPAKDARVLAVVQAPLSKTTFGEKITAAAWGSRPTWYIVSADDRAVSVELQRNLAVAMKAKTTELKASHMSLLSMPDAVAAVIVDAFNAAKA